MKNLFTKILLLAGIILWTVVGLQGQDGGSEATVADEEKGKIRFNGLGRTLLSRTGIEGDVVQADTNTIDRLTDGEFLLDLAVNATPNKSSEVQTIIRLRNEFGGFFGAGMSVEVRELWARGIIADFVKYRVGDMDVVMSPYTLFSPTFDDLQSGNAVTGIRNTVYSVDYDVTILDKNNMSLNLLGESGRSKVGRAERVTDADGKEENVMLSEEDDTFMDVGLTFKLKKEKLTISASYVDIGPDFFSTGAQSKRVEYADGFRTSKTYYDRIGTDRELRQVSNFSLIKAATNINIHQFLDWENSVRATLGLQLESTERGGGEIEEVDLNSTLVDLGLEVEIFPEFDLLLGAKLFNSEGRDYIPVLTGFNEVQDFPRFFSTLHLIKT